MNFAHGTLHKNEKDLMEVRCEGRSFTLPMQRNGGKNVLEYLNEKVVLGIRPEYVHLCEKNYGGAISGRIYSYEDLGEIGYLMVVCDGEKFLIEIESGFPYKMHEEVFFRFDPERVCLFAERSGERVL
jgi:ABC-type sugar transport system ATPase subunit